MKHLNAFICGISDSFLCSKVPYCDQVMTLHEDITLGGVATFGELLLSEIYGSCSVTPTPCYIFGCDIRANTAFISL